MPDNARIVLPLGNGKTAPGTARPLSLTERVAGLERDMQEVDALFTGLMTRLTELEQRIAKAPEDARLAAEAVVTQRGAYLEKLTTDCALMLRALIDATAEAKRDGVPFSQETANGVIPDEVPHG